MKFKVLSIAAMTAILFTACDKEEPGTPDNNNNGNDEKSVFLKFNTTSSTSSRSIEGSTSGKTAELKTAMIYFLNGNNDNSQVYVVKQVGGNGADITMQDMQKGYEFAKMPKDVSHVYVIGNFDNADENGNSAQFPKSAGGKLSDIQKTLLDIEQVNTTAETLSTLLEGMAETIEYGSDNDGWKGAGTPKDDDLYANVKVSPVNSRIELKELEYTGTLLSSFNVEGIYINYYYSKSSLSDLNKGVNDKDGILVNNGSDVTKYTSANYTNYSSMYDLLNTSITATDRIVAAGDNKFWAYQVFGNCTPAHIVVKFTGLKDSEGKDIAGDRYITVGGFRNDAQEVLTMLKRGTVYQLPIIKFSDDDMTVIPEPGNISIWVEVSVAPWDIEFVSPIL